MGEIGKKGRKKERSTAETTGECQVFPKLCLCGCACRRTINHFRVFVFIDAWSRAQKLVACLVYLFFFMRIDVSFRANV